MDNDQPSVVIVRDDAPAYQPLLVQVVDENGVRHHTAFDSDLVKKYGVAPEDPKGVPGEAEVDAQGEDRDADDVDTGSGNRKPKAK